MEYILDFSINVIVALIVLVSAMLLYMRMKGGLFRSASGGRGFFTRIFLILLYAMALSVVLALYSAGLTQFGQGSLYYTMDFNALTQKYQQELYLAAAISGVFFLLLYYFRSTRHKRIAKRRINAIRPIKQKIEAFYEELDQAVFIYLARKNGLEKSKKNFKDYRYFTNMKADLSCKECLITLYYALLLNRKYIGKLDDKLLGVLTTLKQAMPREEKELAAQFVQTIAVFDKMEKKLAEIMAFLKSHKDISVVNDDQMPHFYIDNKPKESMDILGKFEELSIIILDNKHISDELLDTLAARINKIRTL